MIEVELSKNIDSLPNFILSEIEHCIKRIFIDHGKNKGYVHIIIVSDDFLRRMKKKYFGIDVFTDVITFNIEDQVDYIEGEIYISWKRVLENAKIFSIKIGHEFRRVLIHGVLHLIGYNDKSQPEKKIMTDLENKYIALSNTFIKI